MEGDDINISGGGGEGGSPLPLAGLMTAMSNRTDQEQSLDLSLLYNVLATQRNNNEMSESSDLQTWELVIIQLSLLLPVTVLVLCWRYFSSRLSMRPSDRAQRVKADLPPSYSTADLFSLGVSVVDHLHPPPHYLDLEPGPQSRLSLTSCRSCSGLSHLLLPVRSSQPSRTFLRQDSSLSISGSSLRSFSSSRSSSTKSRSGSVSVEAGSDSNLQVELERKLKKIEADTLTTIVEEKY